jgi:hypothetical protein
VHRHQDELGVELDDLLGGGAAQREILLEHVVLDAVRLDVLELGAGGLHEGAERARLIPVIVLQLRGRDLHAPPPEAHEIREPRVGTDCDTVLHGELHGFAHHVRIAAVKAAGDIRGGDVRHHLLVVAERPAAVALTHVAVDVDVDAHGLSLFVGTPPL